MEPSVTGQYFLSSFSSLDFGVPEIVIVNDISKKRYSRKGLVGLIALCTPDKLKTVAEAIERQGGKAFTAQKTNEGVKIET